MGEQPNKPKPKRTPPPSSAQVTAMNPADVSRGPTAPVAHRALPVGSMLGKYKIVSVLGHGGMGNVYAAEDPLIKRRVAIKVLPPEFARDKGLIDRLLAEAQAAGKLNHPNVVTIYDVNHENDSYFIVMELVPGGSVQDYLAKKGSPGWRAATKLIGEACKAIAAAHDIGLIHRDIKPSNLMLTSDGHVKVADFGLAKLEASDATMRTQPGTILGTPAFMSPEQCRGDKVDLRTDIYSLGCTYYAILTGKPPFEAASSMQVMFAHCSAPIPDPRTISADAPDGCVEILQKALAKNPEDRYASAKEMLADLRAVLSGASVTSVTSVNALQALAESAPPGEVYEAPALPEIRRPRQKLPGWVFLVGGLMAGMLIILVLGMFVRSAWTNRRVPTHNSEMAARPKPPRILTEAAPVEGAAPVAQTPVAQSPATALAVAVEASASQPSVHAIALAPTPPVPAQPANANPPSTEPPSITLDKCITNSLGQKLALCPAGTFVMGDKAFIDAPPHSVKLTKPFYIGECEITQGEFAKVLGTPAAERIQRDGLPAAFTSWEQAKRFCELLSDLPAEKAAGRVYRLPSEAEWEYACRAGTTTRYAFGDQLQKGQANFGKDLSIIRQKIEERRGEPSNRPAPGNGPRPRGPKPPDAQNPPPDAPPEDRSQHPLEEPGAYSPNAWGLYDMHGNVWEWCSDFYSADAYKHEETTDPIGPATGKTHVARGGCWSSFAAACASGARNGKAEPNQREPSYGFRVVCETHPAQ